jgi:hypothetical protein
MPPFIGRFRLKSSPGTHDLHGRPWRDAERRLQRMLRLDEALPPPLTPQPLEIL